MSRLRPLGAVAALCTVLLTACPVTSPTPDVHPTSITLSCTPSSIQVGATSVCTAQGRNAAGTVLSTQTTFTYASSDAARASVSSGGAVTGVAPGSASVTAYSGSVTSNAVPITVTAHTLPASLVWTGVAASPTPLYEGQGAAVDGRLYVFGGFFENRNNKPIATSAAHVYDPATDTWAPLHDGPEAVTHAGVATDDHFVYLAGGFLGNHPGPQTDHVWRYDTTTDTWTALPPLPVARGAGALVRLGRDLHYFGGTERTADGAYRWDDADHWALSLDAPTGWRTLAPLPDARNHLGGAVLNGQIYAIGGQHLGREASGDVTDVDRYDPATNTWTSVASLPLPLGHITASTVVWGSRIVVVGGVTLATHGGAIEGQESATVLAYDPALNQWSALTSLPGDRQSPVADTIGGALVVTTGSTALGPVDATYLGR